MAYSFALLALAACDNGLRSHSKIVNDLYSGSSGNDANYSLPKSYVNECVDDSASEQPDCAS